ncbi:hypothetical protein [Levilactobacillus zymae]|uniref:Uncharacterized protein n=1 Tax=Levilactobacillus zymae TaxID=267363 RepID=A0A1Y6JYL1_9LACO|nr:hypothetical protein [Levilactobacillus zymae]MDT6980526.1 hypothetical protein [Levilactobacillus zymae]SMS14192.1 hypothetical protein LZ3411_1142 [Levilactobacillus zymae]
MKLTLTSLLRVMVSLWVLGWGLRVLLLMIGLGMGYWWWHRR